MCEKRQRELHDCEYFEFMDNTYSGMAELRVDKTKKVCKIIFSHWISVTANRNQCVLKKDITGYRTVTGVRGGFLNECKSKYLKQFFDKSLVQKGLNNLHLDYSLEFLEFFISSYCQLSKQTG